jgi:glyoxylase-like metal-dependent hydrolase (beta-lactamase superfamily II)
MRGYICVACGTQFAAADEPPAACLVCEDPRQPARQEGQRWTTLAELGAGHDNLLRVLEPGLVGIGTVPTFAAGQRALLVRTPSGNVLWDCVSLLDQTTITLVEALGGIAAIAISHPHFYSSMIEWGQAFHAPVYLHEADREWVARLSDTLRFWEGEQLEVQPGITLVRAGGHFAGSTLLHWAGGAEGKGVLLTGDTVQVALPEREHVSFMYGYASLLPLAPGAVERIVAAVAPYRFERLYGAWWPAVIGQRGKTSIRRSADLYLASLRGELLL